MNYRFIILFLIAFIIYGCPARYKVYVENQTTERINYKLGYCFEGNQREFGVCNSKIYSIEGNSNYKKAFPSFSVSYEISNHELKPIYILSERLDTINTIRMSFSYLANCNFRLIFPIEGMNYNEKGNSKDDIEYFNAQKLFNSKKFLECFEIIKLNQKTIDNDTIENRDEKETTSLELWKKIWQHDCKKRGFLVMGIICANKLNNKQNLCDYIDKLKNEFPDYWKAIIENDTEIKQAAANTL